MKKRRLLPRPSLGTLLWVAVLGFVGYRIWPQLSAAVGVGEAGEAAPAFELTTFSGEPVSLDALRGQVVLVNFWATWCPPCRVEMPGFQRVYESRRERGFTIVGISTDRGSTRQVIDFLEERGITYPNAPATAQVVRDYGHVRVLPTSFLIDRQGRIRHIIRGFFAEPALAQAVDRLLAEPFADDGAVGPAPGEEVE